MLKNYEIPVKINQKKEGTMLFAILGQNTLPDIYSSLPNSWINHLEGTREEIISQDDNFPYPW